MFSKYNPTKKFWIKKHKLNSYETAENIEKNNKISRIFIEKYVYQIKDTYTDKELGGGCGRNLNIIMDFFSDINYS